MNQLRDELTVIYKYLYDDCLDDLKLKTRRLNRHIESMNNLERNLLNLSAEPGIFFTYFNIHITRMTCKCKGWHMTLQPSQCFDCLCPPAA